jgi:hypothetical protein
MRTTLAFLVAGILVGGCGPIGGVTAAFSQYRPEPGAKVVVLPFTNETADMDIAPTIRRGIAAGFGALGYWVIDLDECDAKLQAGGITQAGQLAVVERRKLGELVGADHIVFGEVEEYGVIPLPVHKTDFMSSFRMVHAPSGETLWVARGDAAGLVGQAYSMYRIRRYRLRGLDRPLAQNDEIAYSLRKALSTFNPKRVIDEEKLASRYDPLIVVVGLAGGPSILGDGQEDRGLICGSAAMGRSSYLFDVGICTGVVPSKINPSDDDTVTMEFDLGVRRTWRDFAALRPFLSGGVSVAITGMEEGATEEEEVVFRPYATAGIDWWLPWGFAVGGRLHLSTAADWAGATFGVSVVF